MRTTLEQKQAEMRERLASPKGKSHFFEGHPKAAAVAAAMYLNQKKRGIKRIHRLLVSQRGPKVYEPRRHLPGAGVTGKKGGIVSQVDLDLATFNERLTRLGHKPKSVERTRQSVADLAIEMIICIPGITMSPESSFYLKGVLLAMLDRAAEFEPMEKGRPQ